MNTRCIGILLMMLLYSVTAVANTYQTLDASCAVTGDRQTIHGPKSMLRPIRFKIYSIWNQDDELADWGMSAIVRDGKSLAADKVLVRALMPKDIALERIKVGYKHGATDSDEDTSACSFLDHFTPGDYLNFYYKILGLQKLQFPMLTAAALYELISQMSPQEAVPRPAEFENSGARWKIGKMTMLDTRRQLGLGVTCGDPGHFQSDQDPNEAKAVSSQQIDFQYLDGLAYNLTLECHTVQ